MYVGSWMLMMSMRDEVVVIEVQYENVMVRGKLIEYVRMRKKWKRRMVWVALEIEMCVLQLERVRVRGC